MKKIYFPGLESHGFMFGSFFTADVKVRRVQDGDITAQTACILVNTRVYVCCTLRKLIFAIRTDGFFLLGINFCDFQKVPSAQH